MSKKHFIALAAAFAAIRNVDARKQAAEAVCAVAADLNHHFDKARFLAACGL